MEVTQNPWIPLQKERPESGEIVEILCADTDYIQTADWRGKAFFIPGTDHVIAARVVFWRERE